MRLNGRSPTGGTDRGSPSLGGGEAGPGEGFGQLVGAADQGHQDLAAAGAVDDVDDAGDDRCLFVP
jgi:hypothetical protein